MARLSACYPLCPLIDRCPLGVTADATPNHVIVTLGKNIVIRYKLSDQKQVSSWSCKDKLSAPVIYDSSRNHYIAVFSQTIIRLWNKVEVDLNKVKKHKFEQPIYIVLSRPEKSEPVVVFQNGSASSLSKALTNRKTKSQDYLPPGMNIKKCFLFQFNETECVGIHASNDEDSVFLIIEVDGSSNPIHTVTLRRQGRVLLGLTVMDANNNSATLLTFWNDSQLWSFSLGKLPLTEDSVGHHVVTVSAVSSQHKVAMIQISPSHVALYGADPSDEGAMLVIVNKQFRLVQARQHYKLFSDQATLWMVDSSILLIVGHSLAVAPFVLDNQRLSSLIGSHKPLLEPESRGAEIEQVLEIDTVVWEELKKPELKSKGKTAECMQKNSELGSQILKKYTSQGYSQSMACELLVPNIINDKDAEALLWTLQNFSDFPESAIVCVLSFILDSPSTTFHSIKGISELGGYEEDSQDKKQSLIDLSIGQRVLLDVVLTTPLNEAVLLPLLRSKLALSHCLTLLQYVAQSLPQARDLSFSHALIWWGAILLDSHYQQLLLSREEHITTTVLALKEIIESQVDFLDDLKALCPMIEKAKMGQSFHNIRSTASYQYCVEALNLYSLK